MPRQYKENLGARRYADYDPATKKREDKPFSPKKINEERAFIRSANLCGEWGFPLSILDIRNLLKNYLDMKGRKKIQRQYAR